MTPRVRLSADLCHRLEVEIRRISLQTSAYVPQLDPMRLGSWQLLVIVSIDGRRSSKTSAGPFNLAEGLLAWNASESDSIAVIWHILRRAS